MIGKANMAQVISSELVRYNANTRGTNTGDCTARSISLAFNIDYRKAKTILNESAKTNPMWNYNSHDNCIRVIKELGGGHITQSDRVSVGDFADNHPSGTYIIWCSKNGVTNAGNHLVTIIDGKIYDSWDSRKYFVKGYWTIEVGIKGSDITDISPYLQETLINSKDIEWYNNYAAAYFDKIIDNNKKIKNIKATCDFDIQLQFEIQQIKLTNYTFKMSYTIDVIYVDVDIKPQTFKGNVVIAFNPTMQPEQVEDYFNKTFYNKFYSFIYDIIVKIEDTCNGYKLTQGNASNHNLTFWSTAEKKSFKSLPYWVQRLATYFRVDTQFQGRDDRPWDTITLWIKTPPFDTQYGNGESERQFNAYYMNELRDGLDLYKRTGDFEEAYSRALGN